MTNDSAETHNKPQCWAELGLDTRLLSAIDDMGLQQPMPVQLETVPAIVAGGDWQITAHTGSGKTLAYLLPAIQLLLSREAADNPYRQPRPRLLVLSPTRELASQIDAVCRQLIRATDLHGCLVTGGEDFGQQKRQLKRNPQIVVATPGRLLEHLEKESIDLGFLEVLVLDEADRMLDMGFRDDVQRIAGKCNSQRQSILVSATLYHKGLDGMRAMVLRHPGNIVINTVREKHASIEHRVILADNPTHKTDLLQRLLDNNDGKKVLVFTNTRRHAEALAAVLQRSGVRSVLLHGEIPHDERKRVLKLFKDGMVPVLVATDVAARGLDIEKIDLVINYDLPHSGDDYAHRSGRTGRAGEAGLTLSLVGPREWNLMLSIQRYLKLTFGRDVIEGLEARFSGPKKQKKSGKAVGRKKKKKQGKQKTGVAGDTVVKVKKRLRDRKNIGKRRKPSSAHDTVSEPKSENRK